MRFSSAGKSTRTWCNVVERRRFQRDSRWSFRVSFFRSTDDDRSYRTMPHSGTTGAKSSPKQTRTSLFVNVGTFEETETADIRIRATRKLTLLIGKYCFPCSVAFAKYVVREANRCRNACERWRRRNRRHFSSDSTWRRRAPVSHNDSTLLATFSARVQCTRDKSIRGHPANKSLENDKAVAVGRERSSGPIRVGTATKKREDGSSDFSLLFTARETRREELVKTSIRCQPITYRVYA